MTQKIAVTWEGCEQAAKETAGRIAKDFMGCGEVHCYAVPRGGLFATLLVMRQLEALRADNGFVPILRMVDSNTLWIPYQSILIDDLIDSGETRKRACQMMGAKHENFYALFDKLTTPDLPWLVFPWETASLPWDTNSEANGPTDAIIRLLQFIGEDPAREGLKDTPTRVLKSYAEIFRGYQEKPQDHLTTFQDGACDEMVIMKDVEFYSVCEHHMQPFFGKAHIAYVPDKKVIGISKLARILDTYARRLQIQERLTQQVITAIDDGLNPKGSACILEAKHFCMVCRGVNKQNSTMITSAMSGVFRENGPARAELLSFIRS